MTFIINVEKIGIKKGKEETMLVMLAKGLSVEEIVIGDALFNGYCLNTF